MKMGVTHEYSHPYADKAKFFLLGQSQERFVSAMTAAGRPEEVKTMTTRAVRSS